MPDLKVDFSLLESTERTLSSLMSEFQNMQAQEGSYDWAMGSGPVAAAMNGFATNWNDNKKSLVSSMQVLGEMITKTIEQFKQTDTRLASSQRTSS